MRARTPIDSKMLKAIKEQVFKDFFAVMQENKALDIIAVAKCFGIGKERMQKYLTALAETREEFDTWKHDDVFEEKCTQELDRLGIDFNWLMGGDVKLHDFKEKPSAEMLNADKEKAVAAFDDFKKSQNVNPGYTQLYDKFAGRIC